MTQGKIIVFSGLDGSGKSTQIGLLEKYFKQNNIPYLYLWTRGGYTSGIEGIKNFFRRISGGKALPPSGNNASRQKHISKPFVQKIWLTIAILDLIRIYGSKIKKLQKKGVHLICDRYLLDTQVDFRLNFPSRNVENWWLWKKLEKITPKPDLALFLTIPVEESIRRSDIKGEPFRDSRDTLIKREKQYGSLVNPSDWLLLDGLKPADFIHDQIMESIKSIID